MELAIQPLDEHNRRLLANVHPPDWVNPTPKPKYQLVVLGGGTAGLVTSIVAAGLGAKVALVEKHLMGGDCLNVGCVPSKAMIASGRAAAAVRHAPYFGVHPRQAAEIDFGAAMARMRRLRADLSANDSTKRFRDHGVDVFLGEGRFTGRDSIEVNGVTLRFSRACIATGARAAVPPIPGLEEVGCLTNETIFSLTERPERLAIIGAGPIGCEMAQTFQRLGCRVTLLEMLPGILGREDRDAAAIIQRRLEAEGVRIVLNCRILSADRNNGAKTLRFALNNTEETVEVDEILVGAGRKPNVEGLGLEAAGVEYDPKSGVNADDFLRTTNPRIYAAGDCCMVWKFTHAADVAAQIVIQNALFSIGPIGRRRLGRVVMPWCTYTEPEAAHVGLYEHEAAERGIAVETYVQRLDEVDRAVVDGDEEGFAKVLVRKGTDEIVGATIVARNAGDLISLVTVAMTNRLGLNALGRAVFPYPTQAEALRKLAIQHRKKAFSPAAQRWVGRFLALRG